MTSYGKSNRERHTKIDQATIFPPEWRGHQTSKIVVASLILFPQGRRLSLSLHICQCMACQQCQSPLRCTVSSNTRATIGISLQSVYLRHVFGVFMSCHLISFATHRDFTPRRVPAVGPVIDCFHLRHNISSSYSSCFHERTIQRTSWWYYSSCFSFLCWAPSHLVWTVLCHIGDLTEHATSPTLTKSEVIVVSSRAKWRTSQLVAIHHFPGKFISHIHTHTTSHSRRFSTHSHSHITALVFSCASHNR